MSMLIENKNEVGMAMKGLDGVTCHKDLYVLDENTGEVLALKELSNDHYDAWKTF